MKKRKNSIDPDLSSRIKVLDKKPYLTQVQMTSIIFHDEEELYSMTMKIKMNRSKKKQKTSWNQKKVFLIYIDLIIDNIIGLRHKLFLLENEPTAIKTESKVSSTKSSISETITSAIGRGSKYQETSSVKNTEPIKKIDLIKTEDNSPLPYDYRSVINKRGSSIPPIISSGEADKPKLSNTAEIFIDSFNRPSNPSNSFLNFESTIDTRPIVNEIQHFDHSSSSNI